MRKFTLKLHQSNFSDKALILNAKDFGDLNKDDIVKIYSEDTDSSNHVIIKVKELNKDGELQKNTISIEQTIATQFNLHAFQSVSVVKVDPADVSLDMVEVLFKDQYVSRSDMWRLKRHLVGSCMFLKEKIEFCDIRAQVNELWIDGVRVKCGLVSDNTRIVLRSATALVYIFIQMSKEMWEFDAYGQLQFEKVINGFLKDLFQNWRGKCYHEFTLVLFSRSYFEVSNLELFPEEIRHVVQTDYRGRYFVDFYYCVAHRERSEDCSPYLSVLKKLFNEYESLIALPKSPPGHNSSSSEGNFLEAINMSLNVFDKHYLDRNFDRTGQLVLCITPGVGVFDVDRDLTILTKERMIDNGIGSDLVCMGQQPLHAVPLFKYHHKRSLHPNEERSHSFNIPHWINHSFYSLNPFLDKGAVGINHMPRASLSLTLLQHAVKGKTEQRKSSDENTYLPLLPSSRPEEFDEEIFKAPGRDSRNSNSGNFERIIQRGNARIGHTKNELLVSKQNMIREDPSPTSRCKSTHTADERLSSSVGPLTNLEKYMCLKKDVISSQLVVGSAHSFNIPKMYPSNRALINPFISSCTTLPISANRRRWVHTYPARQNGGSAMSPHSRSAILSSRTSESSNQTDEDCGSDNESSLKNSRSLRSNSSISGSSAVSGEFTEAANSNDATSHEFLRSSGINWKTLIYPACLPVTNDYFPSKHSLNNEHTEQSYTLIPDLYENLYTDGDGFNGRFSGYDSACENTQQITTAEVFLELVNQRLCQGFQLVVPCSVKHRKHYNSLSLSVNSPAKYCNDAPFTAHDAKSPSRIRARFEDTESYTLNHGRQYHIISLTGENEICVKIYKPRHTFSTSVIEYKYLLWAAGRDRFRMTTVVFTHEQYESYHWNYQDNCVCSIGADSDFKITESIKYWRSKFYIVPSMIGKLRLQKSEAEAAAKEHRKTRYDIFKSDEPGEKNLLSEVDGMVKFFDYVNKARHASQLQRNMGNDGAGTTTQGNNCESNDSDLVDRLLAMMQDENSDFPYLQPPSKLPKDFFLSINAVHWCLSKDVGVGTKEQAIALFEKMRSLNHICHASGDQNHPFVFGYIVFCVFDATVVERPFVSNWQWLEVEIKQNKEICTTSSSPLKKSALTSLLEDSMIRQQKTYLGSHRRKTALVPLNNKNKTGRSEWCQVQYPATILEWRNSLAFNFVIQWTVATATCLCEMLLSWLREANRCNLLMVPSPSNPFSFPVEKDASPLHCPLFIPLNLASVTSLQVLDENECKNRIIDYMEKIAIRFGFIRYFSSLEYESQEENSRHYLHYTGQVFLEIPITSNLKVQGRTVGVMSSLGIPEETHGQESSQFGGLRSILRHCGFYFSPNHMLTKRWRTIACEDCPAPELESDFILFCSGSDNRLNEYYITLYS